MVFAEFKHLKNLKKTIEIRIVDGITKDDHFLIELLSNMDHKEFTWYEEIELKYKLHNYWKTIAEQNKKPRGYRETSKDFIAVSVDFQLT